MNALNPNSLRNAMHRENIKTAERSLVPQYTVSLLSAMSTDREESGEYTESNTKAIKHKNKKGTNTRNGR